MADRWLLGALALALGLALLAQRGIGLGEGLAGGYLTPLPSAGAAAPAARRSAGDGSARAIVALSASAEWLADASVPPPLRSVERVSGGEVTTDTTATPTPTPTTTPSNTPTPTSTGVAVPATLVEPLDGAVLPQPVAPEGWRFVWTGQLGAAVHTIHIEGPGGRHIANSADVRLDASWRFVYDYTAPEPLPDDALAPWRWRVEVTRYYSSAVSEYRYFTVSPAAYRAWLPLVGR